MPEEATPEEPAPPPPVDEKALRAMDRFKYLWRRWNFLLDMEEPEAGTGPNALQAARTPPDVRGSTFATYLIALGKEGFMLTAEPLPAPKPSAAAPPAQKELPPPLEGAVTLLCSGCKNPLVRVAEGRYRCAMQACPKYEPVAPAPPPASTPAPTPAPTSTPTGAPLCPDHKRPMLASKYGDGWYCGGQGADGGRCKVRADKGGNLRRAGRGPS